MLKAVCPICDRVLRVPRNFSRTRSRKVGCADRVYFYHRRGDGSWCPSNGAKISRREA